MSNIITDMGIGIPTGLSKADKQRLVDITNNASNNQDSIKTNMISHVNNKAKTSLPNNSSWINIENVIDGITIENLVGEDINTDHLQIVSDRFSIIFINNNLSNIKYITSDNKYISDQADIYDSNMNLIKNLDAHFDCKDKNDNFYMLSYNSTELTNPHDHNFDGQIVTAYDYIISMTLKKYDSNFNLVFSKNISFTLPDMHYSSNDEEPYRTPYPTIFKQSQVLCTDTYIYFFILINDNETWGTGILHVLRMKLDGSDISIIKTITSFANELDLSCLYSSKNFITFQGIIRYTSTSHYEFYILLDDDRKVMFSGGNAYDGLHDVLSMCFDDTYIYTAIAHRTGGGQQSLRLFMSKISDLENGSSYINSSSVLILTVDASSTSSISQTVGQIVQIDKPNEFIFLGGVAMHWMRSLNNKSFYGNNISSSNNNNNLVLFDKEGYILCGVYKLSSKIKYTVIA